MVDSKVLIGCITGEYARRADFYDYINLMEKPANSMLLFCHDRSPAHGRNLIIEAAIQENCTHVLFIDDDMTPKKDALLRLLSHNVDAVTGLYLGRAYPHQPLIFDDIDDEGHAIYSYLEDEFTGLVKIANAGFGFVLIKTDVFKTLDKPWVRLGELDPAQWCDDIGFFNRYNKAGFELYCDLDVRVGHIGTMIIWPNYEKDSKWYTGYDTGGEQMLNTPQIIPVPKYSFEEK